MDVRAQALFRKLAKAQVEQYLHWYREGQRWVRKERLKEYAKMFAQAMGMDAEALPIGLTIVKRPGWDNQVVVATDSGNEYTLHHGLFEMFYEGERPSVWERLSDGETPLCEVRPAREAEAEGRPPAEEGAQLPVVPASGEPLHRQGGADHQDGAADEASAVPDDPADRPVGA